MLVEEKKNAQFYSSILFMRKYNVQSLSILQQYTIPYKNSKFFAKKKKRLTSKICFPENYCGN